MLEGEKDIDIDMDVSLETAEDVVYKNGIPISQAQKERSDRINRCRELLG